MGYIRDRVNDVLWALWILLHSAEDCEVATLAVVVITTIQAIRLAGLKLSVVSLGWQLQSQSSSSIVR